MLRLAATGLLAAVAIAGLSACSLDGSAHPTAVVPDASTTSATAQATATATPAPVSGPATGSPAAAAVNGAGTGRPATGGSAPVQRTTGGTTSGGTGTTGGSGSGGGAPAPAPPSPKVTNLHVAKAPVCPVTAKPGAPFSSPGDQNVTIAWTVSGASGAALSVDQPGTYGAYSTGLPASGSLELPVSCVADSTVSHTYTIFPAGTPGVSRSITVSAHSDG